MAPSPNGRLFNAAFLSVVRKSGFYHRSAHQAITSCPYFLLVSKLEPALFGLFGLSEDPGGDARLPIPLHTCVPDLLSTSSDSIVSSFCSSSHACMSECSAWNANKTTKKDKIYMALSNAINVMILRLRLEFASQGLLAHLRLRARLDSHLLVAVCFLGV